MSRICSPGARSKVRRHGQRPPEQLLTTTAAGANKICVVKSNLTGVQQDQMVLNKNRRSWYRKGTPFYHLQFDVHVIVAPADLRFELWFNGYRFSGNHEPIAVTWA